MPTQKETSTERIALQLRQRIFAGAFAAGSPLREEDLAAEFEVSRHVVREVLRMLAAEGLADYASFRGARVPLLTKSDVHDIYRARRLVECGSESFSVPPDVKRLAAIHYQFADMVRHEQWLEAFDLDLRFHSILAESTGIDRATAWHRDLLQGLRLAHLVAPAFKEQALTDSIAEHAEIVLALTAHEFDRAREIVGQHLEKAEQSLIESMASTGGKGTASARREAGHVNGTGQDLSQGAA